MIRDLTFILLTSMIFGAGLPVFGSKLANLQPRDVFDEADSLLIRYRTTIDFVKAIAYAEQQETEEKFRSIGGIAYNTTRGIINDDQNSFMAQLNHLDDLASELQIDDFYCTSVPKRQLGLWSSTILSYAELCSNEMTRQSVEAVKNALASLQNLDETADEFAERIQGCRAANDEICVSAVVSEMNAQDSALPAMLESEIEKIRDSFSELELKLQGCSTSQHEQYSRIGRDLVEDASNCFIGILP